MRLKDKLTRLSGPGPGRSRRAAQGDVRERSGGEDPPPRAGAEEEDQGGAWRAAAPGVGLRAQLEAVAQRGRVDGASVVRGPRAGGAALPGEEEDTPWGPLRRVRSALPPTYAHGRAPLAEALRADPQELAILALDPAIAAVDLRRALYVDTETTGLSGGAGTLPFLIGAAWFEGEQLHVEQSLLPRPGEEVPMLRRLAERMAAASCLVSYNGKSFDWPLLRTRFILNRVPVSPPPPHLDLLHCARRVFKRRLGAVRLVHLEQHVLGFERVDDVPGELIPRIYLDVVRGRAPGGALAPVVEHNRHDLVALAAFLGELARRFGCGGVTQDARDSLSFAEVAARARRPERARALAEAAADADLRGQLAPQALVLAGGQAAKRADYRAAEDAYRRAIEAAGDDAWGAAPAHLALAKLYEHRLRDLRRALEHAAHTTGAEDAAASAKRCARLRRRLARQAARAQGGAGAESGP